MAEKSKLFWVSWLEVLLVGVYFLAFLIIWFSPRPGPELGKMIMVGLAGLLAMITAMECARAWLKGKWVKAICLTIYPISLGLLTILLFLSCLMNSWPT